MKRRGFTIVEIAVVLSIATVLLAIMLSRFSGFIDRIEVRGAINDIQSLFSLARHAAIARGTQVTLDIDVARRTLSVRAGTEGIRTLEVGAQHGVVITANRSAITYSPIGVGYGAANFSLIVSRGDVIDTVVVSRLGRVRH